MIYYEKMKYIESGTLCFFSFLCSSIHRYPRLWMHHIRLEKKTLEAAKTTGKIAAFSIHSNELILAEDIFIFASPPPPPSRTRTHPQSCLGAWWLSGTVLEMRSDGSGWFETHRRHCMESLSKTLDLCLSAG